MKKPKLKQIPLSSIKPTEPAILEDKLHSIASHYDGDENSIKPITGYQLEGFYYPDNGNHRAVFLYLRTHTHILAYVQPFDQDEVAQLQKIHQKVAAEGVHTIDDLAQRVFQKRQYYAVMRVYERKK